MRPIDPQLQTLDLGQQIVALLRAAHDSPLIWIAALDVARSLLPVQAMRRHIVDQENERMNGTDDM